MALTTPVSITVDGTTYALKQTYVLGSKAEYVDATGMVKLITSHKYTGTRVSRLFRVEMKHVLADSSVTKESFHTVWEYDVNKVSATQAKNLAVGAVAVLTAATNAVIIQLTSGEF